MCGIVGMVNGHPVARDIVIALGRLDYRGYDSAGIAVAGPGFDLRKVAGGVSVLMDSIGNGFAGQAGIGRTRWATHGRADTRNAHPHVWDGVAVVHNGIIENYRSLRNGMLARGETFESETDSEVIPHLIAAARASGAAPLDAVRGACAAMQGDYAIAVLFEDAPDRIIVARQGSPVMVARGARTSAVASDPAALSAAVRRLRGAGGRRHGGTLGRRRHHLRLRRLPDEPLLAEARRRRGGRPRACLWLVHPRRDRHPAGGTAADRCQAARPGHSGASRRGGATGADWLRQLAARRRRGPVMAGMSHRHPLRRGGRQRIPHPRGAAVARHRRRAGFAVRRDRRHAGCDARCSRRAMCLSSRW